MSDDRDARRAAALRENLRRRKAQSRGRAEGASTPDDQVSPASGLEARLRAVLDFWFGAPGDPLRGSYRDIWFKRDDAFDDAIRTRFLADHEDAAAGAFDPLMESAEGCLGLCIMLDQFPRNLFRGTPRAFATDAKARSVARIALASGFDRQLSPIERWFIYLPFEHHENLEAQRRAVTLYESLPDHQGRTDAVNAARQHLAIIERFGRFPHRNAALGRASTAEEIEFLTQPGSSF